MTNNFNNINTWIFDMDHCLYPLNKEIADIYKARFVEYVNDSCGIPVEDVEKVAAKMREKYGDARIGLMKEYDFTIEGWRDKVWGLAVSKTTPCMETVKLIENLSGKKIVCTNANKDLALHVLSHLGMENTFNHINTFSEDRDFTSKPDKQVYTKLVDSLDLNPKTCAFFEDSHINLKVPHELGMTTVLVHGEKEGRDYIHHAYPTLLDCLKEINKNAL